METDFAKLRMWRHVQVLSAVIMIVLVLIDLAEKVFFVRSNVATLSLSVAALAVAVTNLCVYRYSRCPHCGKSLMSTWLGRDAAGRNCVTRIEKCLPVLCAHCGEEADTDN